MGTKEWEGEWERGRRRMGEVWGSVLNGIKKKERREGIVEGEEEGRGFGYCEEKKKKKKKKGVNAIFFCFFFFFFFFWQKKLLQEERFGSDFTGCFLFYLNWLFFVKRFFSARGRTSYSAAFLEHKGVNK